MATLNGLLTILRRNELCIVLFLNKYNCAEMLTRTLNTYYMRVPSGLLRKIFKIIFG